MAIVDDFPFMHRFVSFRVPSTNSRCSHHVNEINDFNQQYLLGFPENLFLWTSLMEVLSCLFNTHDRPAFFKAGCQNFPLSIKIVTHFFSSKIMVRHLLSDTLSYLYRKSMCHFLSWVHQIALHFQFEWARALPLYFQTCRLATTFVTHHLYEWYFDFTSPIALLF